MAANLDQRIDWTLGNTAWRFVERDAARLGGVPVFRGTRVPIKSLFDHMQAGDSLAVFLQDFPGVTREQGQAVLDPAARHFLAEVATR
jgi:uncharacterized protein (DUF433 family)